MGCFLVAINVHDIWDMDDLYNSNVVELDWSTQYKFIQGVMDELYDICVNHLADFDSLTIDKIFIVTPGIIFLDKAYTFILAEKVGLSWQLVDFRLSDLPSTATELRLPGFKMYWPGMPNINVDWIKLIKIKFLQISNVELTTQNHWWYVKGDGLVDANTVGMKWSAYDLLADVGGFALLMSVVYALSQLGLPDIAQELSSKISSRTLINLSKTASNIVSTKEKAEEIKTQVGNGPSSIVNTLDNMTNTMANLTSVLASLTTVINNIYDLADDLPGNNEALLTKLNQIKEALGVRLILR